MSKFTFLDKTVRLIAGGGLLWNFKDSESLWLLLGAWLIITAFYGCPLYRFLPCLNKQNSQCCSKI